ncbi:type II toxin-antitoxin system PemK/MazF family toxin [Rarobacter faecitabidus]|nr:type II toxin-antitoxin system PemK/MazF family toxin [Rarobacter faecitabidus]
MLSGSKFDKACLAAIYFAAVMATCCYAAASLAIGTDQSLFIAMGWLFTAALATWLLWLRAVTWSARSVVPLAATTVILLALLGVARKLIGTASGYATVESLLGREPETLIGFTIAGAIFGLVVVSTRPGGRQPRAGQFWMAEVPFEDGTGAKDRPCLIVGGSTRRLRVLYVTSQDKSARPGQFMYLPSQNWSGAVGRKQSWIRVAQPDGSSPLITVHRRAFRRSLGRVDRTTARMIRERLRSEAR